MPARPWKQPAGSPAARCGCDAAWQPAKPVPDRPAGEAAGLGPPGVPSRRLPARPGRSGAGPALVVPGCDRSGWEYGLCSAHARRWKDQGRPDRDVFLANPGPELNGRRELTTCTVPGCRFGSSGLGLCMRHRDRWARSGQPDPALWAASVPAVSADGRLECQLPFCKAHHTRWHQLGRPEPEQYVAHCVLRGRARIDFSILAPQLKWSCSTPPNAATTSRPLRPHHRS